jgi:hypothetical protein
VPWYSNYEIDSGGNANMCDEKCVWVGLDRSRFESSRRGSASGRITKITQNTLLYAFNPRIRPIRVAKSEGDMSFLFPDTQGGGGYWNDG